MEKINSSVIVGFDNMNEKDIPVLVVAKKKGNIVEIINEFSGADAEELWKKLTVREEA